VESSGSAAYKVYKLRGKVVSTDATKCEVTLNHEAIPGVMEAMTMPYKLKDASILSELHAGDIITSDVLVSPDPDPDYLLDHIVVVGQAKPDNRPPVSYHVPMPGDAIPDFKLRNQDRKTGMIWHELSQSAGFIDWTGKYPCMFVHVDVTFQFLAAVGHRTNSPMTLPSPPAGSPPPKPWRIWRT
jgi:hypothetical protein